MNLKKMTMVVLALGMAVLTADSASGQEQFEAFLQIEGIPGKIKIDVRSTNWRQVRGMPDPLALASAGAKSSGPNAGQTQMQDFSISKEIDQASPKIGLACTQGTTIPRATIEICRAGGEKQPFFRIRMEGVKITSIRPAGGGGGGGAARLERVTFQYKTLKWERTPPTRQTIKVKKK